MPENPYYSEIYMGGMNFAPRGYALCNGQILPISSNTALFSLLGTTYGGNGQTTFALPDLRGRVPMHWGQGPGLSQRYIGETGGSENVTLTNLQLPAHVHGLVVNNDTTGMVASGGNAFLNSKTESGEPVVASALSSPATLNSGSITPSGGNQPHPNVQPFLCVSFYIALEGLYPSRN